MKILKVIHRKKKLNLQGKTFYRNAARGIVWRDRQFLLIHSPVNGDYKFPGGGVAEGETFEQALAREIEEECGAQLARICAEFGCVVEYDRAEEPEFDIMKMSSFYYLCEVDQDFQAQCLDDYEVELGFQPVWVDIDVALANNLALLQRPTSQPPGWTRRDTFVLGLIKKLIFGELE